MEKYEIKIECEECKKEFIIKVSLDENIQDALTNLDTPYVLDVPDPENVEEDKSHIVCNEECEKKLYKRIAAPLCGGYNKQSPDDCSGDFQFCIECKNIFCCNHLNDEDLCIKCENHLKEQDEERIRKKQNFLSDFKKNIFKLGSELEKITTMIENQNCYDTDGKMIIFMLRNKIPIYNVLYERKGLGRPRYYFEYDDLMQYSEYIKKQPNILFLDWWFLKNVLE